MSSTKSVTGKIVDWNVLKRLLQFVKPYKWQFAALILLTTLSAALVPLRPYVIQYTIDNDVANGDYKGLVDMILVLVGLLFIQAIIQYIHTYLSGWIGQYIVKDILVSVFHIIYFLNILVYHR